MTKLLLLTTSCVICLVIAGCGGGQDDFEQLQSLSPINELIGTWEIEGIANKATLTMDGEATPDDGNFMTFASNITITADACTVNYTADEYVADETNESVESDLRCVAGDDQVIVEISLSGSVDGCAISLAESYTLGYDAETGQLLGTFVSQWDSSGYCYAGDDAYHTTGYSAEGTAIGTNEATALEIPSPHIDGDTSDPLSSGISSTDDYDGDGLVDTADNCWTMYNPLQNNLDGDAWGDVCELANLGIDDDSDGWQDGEDNCNDVFNEDQLDSDADNIGDACDTDEETENESPDADTADDDTETNEDDTDSDGVLDDNDNCANDFNADQTDTDADGLGDPCDADKDGDGLCDSEGSLLCSKIDPDSGKKNPWFYVDASLPTTTFHFVIAGDYDYLPGSKDTAGNIAVDGVQSGAGRQTYKRCPGHDDVTQGICVLEEALLVPFNLAGINALKGF